ncbi:MAG: endonuclease/exonuclease/phosphatase family protein [Planctomycetes bacterium]|nr:endonuclease/exonuclease/phosphatase family protein [Planctomycetota bacterium]
MPDASPLRLASWNTWGPPLVAPGREARMEAVGRELASRSPDVVCLQEVFFPEARARLESALRAAGLVHLSAPAPLTGPHGLLVASRHPILEEAFTPFEVCGKPWKPWHADWYAGKGFLRVTLATPAGELDVYDTHLHARYRDVEEYAATRAAQALQLAEAMARRTAMGRAVVVAGDLNIVRGEPELAAVRAISGLDLERFHHGLDAIGWRDGSSLALRSGETEVVPGAGRSDHDLLVAALALEPRDAVGERTLPAGPRGVPRVLVARLEEARAAARQDAGWGASLTVALALAATWSWGRARRRGGRAGAMAAVLATALALAGASYTLGHAARQFAGMDSALARARGPRLD